MTRFNVLLCVGVLALGCGSDPDAPGGPDGGVAADGSPEDGDAEPEAHALMPEVAYSGFDGERTYQVPVYTTMEDAVFAVEDGAVAEVEPLVLPEELEEVLGSFGKSWAMITTLQPGTTAFTASAGAIELEATLVVAEYDPAVVAAGEERYNAPANANETDRIACQSCHGAPDGADHTPLAMAYFQDAEILQMVVEGQYPEGGEVNGGNHRWNLTEAEQAGIVPYLRSLQPRGL